MCGISALIGENCVQRLLEALRQLQNRGYDSAGLCSIEKTKSEILVHKFASTQNVSALIELEQNWRRPISH